MILIIGNYTNAHIVEKRKLPAPNPAASSRMLRIAKSLKKSGVNTAILSSANAANIGFNKKIIDKNYSIYEDEIKIYISTAITIPFLSILWELISLPFLFLMLIRKNQVSAVVLYCYYPSIVLIGLIAKFKKIKILEDLQDIVTDENISISEMSLLDYLRQKFGKKLMELVLKISDVIIIPTFKFVDFIPKNKFVINISGCFEIDHLPIKKEQKKGKIKILYSGLLNKEQGINLLFETLSELNNVINVFDKYKIIISGYGFDELYMINELKKLNNLDIDFLGYIGYTEYEKILLSSHVCLALQDPNGVFGYLKTPSKAFEYMAKGKMIIVSNVGDFSLLPIGTVFILKNYNSIELFKIINNLNFNEIKTYGDNAHRFAIENWSYEVVGDKIINSIKNSQFI